MIPLFKVFMANCSLDHVNQVLMSGYIGDGPMVQNFEKKFGDYIHNPGRVVAVNSGTAAITMALRLAGVGPGDYVVTTPMTCLATNMPILSLGAHPVWADILPDGTIDPEDVEKKCTPFAGDGAVRIPKAILCVDWGGLPCKLNELKAIADKHGIPLIQDAAQSVGGGYNGKPTGGGSPADYICYSFQAIKHLTTGDGGALVVNAPEKLEEARLMKWFGLDRTKSSSMRCGQDPPFWGYKAHMNDIAAAIGVANLRTICWVVRKTRAHAQIFNRRFGTLEHFKPVPYDRDRGRSSNWLYTGFVEDRARFISYMKEGGVEGSPVHDRNDAKTIFRNYRTELPGVDYFDAHHVCLPVGWWLQPEDIETIVRLVGDYRG